MASATLNYGIPYPLANDSVNIPSDIQDLAEQVDSSIFLVSSSVNSSLSLVSSSIATNSANINLKANKSGDTFTGTIYGTDAIFSNGITAASAEFTGSVSSSLAPTLSIHLANKQYVDFIASGNNVKQIISQSSSYTLQLTDSGNIVELSSSSAVTLTIPENGSVAFDVGTTIDIVKVGLGDVTISPSSSTVYIRSTSGTNVISTQYGRVSLYKRSTNEWNATGDWSDQSSGPSGGASLTDIFLYAGM